MCGSGIQANNEVSLKVGVASFFLDQAGNRPHTTKAILVATFGR